MANSGLLGPNGEIFGGQSSQVESPDYVGNDFFVAARDALKLTPQEQNLYQMHLSNLAGDGKVKNPDGSISTLFQETVEHNGLTYNIPTVWDGKKHSPDEAQKHAATIGWNNFPAYTSEKNAESRYQAMHQYMEKDVKLFLDKSALKGPAPVDAGSELMGPAPSTAAESDQTQDDNKPGFFKSLYQGSQLLQDIGTFGNKALADLNSGDVEKGFSELTGAIPAAVGERLQNNQFANDARIAAGISNYDVNIDYGMSGFLDTNQRLAQAVKAKAEGHGDDRQIAELQTRSQQYQDFLGTMRDALNDKTSTLTNLKKQGQEFLKNPSNAGGQFVGGMLDSVASDPELFAIGGKSTAINKVMMGTGVASKVANFGINVLNSKWTRGAVEGSAMIAPIDMSQQLNEKGRIDLGQTGANLTAGIVLGVLQKGMFNSADLAGLKQSVQNKLLSGLGSGKSAISDIASRIASEIKDKETAAALKETATAMDNAGASYSVESLDIPRQHILKGKDPVIEAYDNPPKVGGIEVSEEGIPKETQVTHAQSPVVKEALDSLNTLPIENKPLTASTHGLETTELPGTVEDITLGETPRKPTARPFKNPENTTRIPTITIEGTGFKSDIMDDDGFKMGQIQGRINGNTVTPMVGEPAARDKAMFPNAVNNAWENLVKYAIKTGRMFTTMSRLDSGKVDFFNDLKSKGYSVIENPNWAMNWETGDRVSTDGEPLYKVTGHQKGAGAPELIEAKKSVQGAINEFRRNNQAGFANPKTLIPLSLFGLGFGYGYSQQHSIMQGFKDAGLASLAMLLPALPGFIKSTGLAVARSLRGIGDTHYRLGDIGTEYNNLNQQIIPYKGYVLRNALNALLGRTEDHHNTFMYLMGDKDRELNPNEKEAVKAVKLVTDQLGASGAKHGVIDEAMDDFFTRWVKPGPNAPEIAKNNWGKYKPWKERNYPNGLEGLKKLIQDGYEPVTENVGDIMENYVTSMWRAIELRKFSDALKVHELAKDVPAVMTLKDAPKDYIPLNGTMTGYAGHPDIAHDVNFLLDFPRSDRLGKAYDLVNYAMKRGELSLSLFHPGQLAKNYVFANTGSALADRDPVRIGTMLTGIAKSINPRADIHTMIREGNPVIEDALKHGVTLSIKRTVEDFGNDAFYQNLEGLSKWADSKMLPGASDLIHGYAALNKLNDKIAFEMIQNYFKMDTYMREVKRQTELAWNRSNREPGKINEPDMTAIKKQVASYVNDLFGGENYYQIVQDTQNWFMKNLKGELFKPSTRAHALQRLEYAPDWTLSVIRSFSQAIPGISDSRLGGQLHRRFILGLATMAFTAANAVNYHYTGKYIWENKNPGYINLGNGYKMQWDKQLSELADAWEDPIKWTANRMAAFPRFGLEVLTNQQYISQHRAPPIVPNRDHGLAKFRDYAEHFGSKFIQLSAHQAFESPSGKTEFNKPAAINAIGSFVSFPIYREPGYGKGSEGRYNPAYIKKLLQQYRPKKRKLP